MPAVKCCSMAAINGVDSACRLAWRFRSTTRTRRHAGAADAPRQLEFLVTALRGVVERLERRRRRAEHHGDVQALRADDGEIARRVAKAALLLERRVVLLVDDDEARRRQRCEHRRARADDEARFAAIRASPRVESLALGDGRVQHGELFAEAVAQSAHELRRQADLRHEQQSLPAGRELRRDEPQVDLGLAAARHAVQQIGAKAFVLPLASPRPSRAPRADRRSARAAGPQLRASYLRGSRSGGAAGSIQPFAASRASASAVTSWASSSLAVNARSRSDAERSCLLPAPCARAARDPARGRAP